jgi:hypothetical protein
MYGNTNYELYTRVSVTIIMGYNARFTGGFLCGKMETNIT